MMTISCRAAGLALAASLLVAGSAFAQTTTTPATGAPATPMADSGKKAQKPRTAASLECSKEADAKGLHGKKVRGPFMRQCKKDKAAAAASGTK